MPFREFHYRWEFDLQSPPEKLWPLVADTNRFNRDTGVPAVKNAGEPGENGRRLRLTSLGIPIEWEEQPFEWVRPQRFGVVRRYSKGPMEELRVRAELEPLNGGTKLVYELWARPKNLLGAIAIPLQIGIISARNFARTFREYDKTAQTVPSPAIESTAEVEFTPGGRARLIALGERLVNEGIDEQAVAVLVDQVEKADEFALLRIRPYHLADKHGQPRRQMLEACLQATRAG